MTTLSQNMETLCKWKTTIEKSWKHCDKRRNFSLWAIPPCSTKSSNAAALESVFVWANVNRLQYNRPPQPVTGNNRWWWTVYPSPHKDAFWRICSRRLLENKVTKEEIAQNQQFLLLPQCFPLLVIGYPFNYRDFSICWQNMSKVVCCRIVVCGEGLSSACNC